MNKSVFLRMPHEADFQLYESYLEKRTVFLKHKFVRAKVVAIHKKVYYLNDFVTRLRIDDDVKCYLNELVVDFILIMDLLLLNYLKNIRMSLRAAIEEFNRYLLARRGEDCSQLSVYRLNENVKKLYKRDPYIHNKVSQLLSDYSNLCNYVHVTTGSPFSDKLVLKDFNIINESEINKLFRQITRVLNNLLFILILENKTDFLAMNKHMQSYLLEQLSTDYNSEIQNIIFKQ
jgi:hypothetical protein